VKFETKMKLLIIILLTGLAIAVCFLISSCEILKSKRVSSVDSVSVTKKTESNNSDSSGGRVSKEENKSKTEYERTTVVYPPRDTNVFNFYNQPPSAIIYEKGKTEQASSRVDSGWYKLIELQLKSLSDSLSKKAVEKNKDVEKETKGVGLIAVLMISLGVVILFKLMGWGLGKFTIVRK
jgi:flagellar basal body-associated protein FliL